MILRSSIIQKWRSFSEHGDIKLIARTLSKERGVSINTARVRIYKAFKTRLCSTQDFEIIADFYKQKQKFIQKKERQVLNECD